MIKLLLLLPLALCSCDAFVETKEMDGHIYLHQQRQFVHDPNCPKCKEMQHKYINQLERP